MPARRMVAAVLLALVAIAVAVASTVWGSPAVAASAVTVDGIGSPQSGGIDVLLPDSGALWVRASIRSSSADDATTLFSTDDLQFTDGQRGWFTDDTIRLPAGTAYGDYPVDVDFRLATGTVQHWSGAEHGPAALFHYRRHVGVTAVAADRTVTDLDHPDVTLTGSVDVLDPGAGTTEAAGSGARVRVAWTSNGASHSVTVETDDGGFRAVITPGGRLTDGSAVVVDPPDDTAADAPVPVDDVSADAMRVRILGGPTSERVHAGSHVLETGTVQRLTDRGWRPFAGARVVTGLNYPAYTTPRRLGSGVSDSAGHYSYPIAATRTATTYTYVPESDYVVSDNAAAGQLHVPTRATPTGLSFGIDQYHRVRSRGALRGSCSDQTLHLQLSSNGRTGWTTIATGRTSDKIDSRPCSFDLTGIGASDGYYRVTHAESDELLSFSSAVHRLRRTDTRITGFGMTPAHATAASTLRATGRVTQRAGRHWKAIRHATVVVVFRPRGSKTWYRVTKGTTSSGGRFRLAAKGRASRYGSGSWSAFYAADAHHFYSQAAVRDVVVH